MVSSDQMVSDVPSCKNKGRKRRKHKSDVIKIIEPEDCVVAPIISNKNKHIDGYSTQEHLHQFVESEKSTQRHERLTLSPTKVPDEIYKERVKKKKTDSVTKMSPNHRKRGRGAGPKRKLSLSSESEIEGTDHTEGRMRRKSGPTKALKMITCNACLKEMTQTEYRRHNRLPHEQECTVPGCMLSFSDKADLQQHRRTAHFLANSNRKSWVASAMDQCHVCEKPFQTQKKLSAHLLSEHGISDGDQLFTASQEDLTAQIAQSNEITVISKVEIKHEIHTETQRDKIQVELEKEKLANDTKEDLKIPEKKRRRSSKKQSDTIAEGLVKVEEDFIPLSNLPTKSDAFYAQLKKEGITECPICLFYFEDNCFEKHSKKDHNIHCSVENCHLKFHLGSFEMSHFHTAHPGMKPPGAGKVLCKECSQCGQGIDGKSIHSHVKTLHSEQCPECNLRFVSNSLTYCSITNHRVIKHILPSFRSSIESKPCDMQIRKSIQQSLEKDEIFLESLPFTSTATEVNTAKIKKKRGRPSRQSLDEKILSQIKQSTKDGKIENTVGKITIKNEFDEKVTNPVEDNIKASDAVVETSSNQVKQEPFQLSHLKNEEILNMNKGRPKKKRSKSAQGERSDVKRLRVLGLLGANDEGHTTGIEQEVRRSQDGNLHQGLREMWSLSPKKEISTINFNDIQDFSVSSTIDETDLLTNPVSIPSPSYSPESTTVHFSFLEDNKSDIKLPVDSFNQTAADSVPGTLGQSRRSSNKNFLETCKQSSEPDSHSLPGTSKQSTSPENFTNQVKSPFPGINVIPNIVTLNSAPNIEDLTHDIEVKEKSEVISVPQENIDRIAPKYTIPTQARHPISLIGVPLVPYAIDSESELSSLEDDGLDTVAEIREKSPKIKQEVEACISDKQLPSIPMEHIETACSVEHKLSNHKPEFKTAVFEQQKYSYLQQQKVESAEINDLKSSSSNKKLETSVKFDQTMNMNNLKSAKSIELKTDVGNQDFNVNTDQFCDSLKQEFGKEKQSIILDNSIETFNDTVDNKTKILEPVSESKLEAALTTTNQNEVGLSTIKSFSTNKDFNVNEGTKSSKIRIKFNQQKGKSVPPLQLTETPAVIIDQEYLTSVNDIEKEKLQNSLVSKIHLFEENEIVELHKDEVNLYQNDEVVTANTEKKILDIKEVNIVSDAPLADTNNISFEVSSNNEIVSKADDHYYTSKDNIAFSSDVYKEVKNQLKDDHKVVARNISNTEKVHDSADIISILDDIKKAANTSSDKEIINEIKKQKTVVKGAKKVSNVDQNKELGKFDIKRHKQTGAIIDKSLINQVNTSRPSVIMSTKSLLSTKPVTQATDMAKIISSLPKIPKKERSSPSPAQSRVNTPTRRSSKDIEDNSDNANKMEKRSEIKQNTTKHYLKEKDKTEVKTLIQGKPIIKKRGRPKRDKTKDNVVATDTDSVNSNFCNTKSASCVASIETIPKEDKIITETSMERDINVDHYEDTNKLNTDPVEHSLKEKDLTIEISTSKIITTDEKVDEIEVTKDVVGADDFDLFSQLDDLEKSIREEEMDSKENSDNERSTDVNDLPIMSFNEVENDNAYEVINVSSDSVMEVEPDRDKEQSIEAIQELIESSSSQRIKGNKYLTDIPGEAENLITKKTSSKHDFDSDDDELGKFSPLSFSQDVPENAQDEDSKSADPAIVKSLEAADNVSMKSSIEDVKYISENMESISAFISSQSSSRSETESTQNRNVSQPLPKSNEDIESISAFISSESSNMSEHSVTGSRPMTTNRQSQVNFCRLSESSLMNTKIGEESITPDFSLINRNSNPAESSQMSRSRTGLAMMNTSRPGSSQMNTSRQGSSLMSTSRPGSSLMDTSRSESSPINTSRPGSSLINTSRPGSSLMNLTRASDGDGIIDDLLAESDEDDSELAEKPYFSLSSNTKSGNLSPNISKENNCSNNYSNKSSDSISYNFVPFGYMPESFRALSVSTSKFSNSSEKTANESSTPISVSAVEKTCKPESPLKSLTPKSSNIEMSRKMSPFGYPKKSLTPEKIGRVSSSSPSASTFSPFRSLTRPSTPSSAKKKKKKKHATTKKKCPICELEMKVVGEYDAHVKQDHNKACPYCHLKFTYNHGLEDHIASQHNMEADIYNSAAWHCIKCDKSFTREKKFKSHSEKLHKHRCSVKRCKMAFVLSSDLESHIAKGHSSDKGKTEKVKATPAETVIFKSINLPKTVNSSPILPLPETSTLKNNFKSFTIPKTNAGKKGFSSSTDVVVASSTTSHKTNDTTATGMDTSGDEDMMVCEFCKMRFPFEEFMEHSDLQHNFSCSEAFCGLAFVHEDTKLEHEFNAHGLKACAAGQSSGSGYSTGEKRQTRKFISSRKENDDIILLGKDDDFLHGSERDTSLEDLLGSPQFKNDQEPRSEVKNKKNIFVDSLLMDYSSANVSYDERASVSSVNASRSFDAVEYLESDLARKYRKQLQCYQCDAQFQNKGDYERHMEYEHDEEPSLIPPSPEPEDQDDQEGEDTLLEPAAATQTCHICQMPTEDLIGHLKLVHSESKQVKMVTQSSCNHCGVKFSTPLEYHKHAEIKHSFPCKGCKMTFIMETDLKTHTEKVHGSKTGVSGSSVRIQPTSGGYTCEFCGHENNKRSMYDRHIAKLHNVGCTEMGCEKMFVDDSDLKQHLIRDHCVSYFKIGDNYEAKFTPGRSKLNAKIMDEAEKWIASPLAKERMQAILKGQHPSQRHELFFVKNEREQCNGRNTSDLHNLSNGRFFGDRDDLETNIIEFIRLNIVEPMVREGTADKRLIKLFEVKEQSLLYTSLVMCPETFIHLCEAKYKMLRIKAENQFLEFQMDKEDLENMRKGTTVFSPPVSPRRDEYSYTSSEHESDGDSDNTADSDTD